jgi:hypothetical protein
MAQAGDFPTSSRFHNLSTGALAAFFIGQCRD